MRSSLFAAASAVALWNAVPAMAQGLVPPPPQIQVVPFSDHSKVVPLFVNQAPQHFSYAWVTPKGDGKFHINWRCENGHWHEPTNAVFTVQFLSGDDVLYSAQFECILGPKRSDQPKLGHAHDADLSDVIDRVNQLRFIGAPSMTRTPSIFPAPGPTPMLPGPFDDRYHQPGTPRGT